MKNMGRQVFTCLPMLIYPGKKNQKSHNNFYQFFDKEGFFIGHGRNLHAELCKI